MIKREEFNLLFHDKLVVKVQAVFIVNITYYIFGCIFVYIANHYHIRFIHFASSLKLRLFLRRSTANNVIVIITEPKLALSAKIISKLLAEYRILIIWISNGTIC